MTKLNIDIFFTIFVHLDNDIRTKIFLKNMCKFTRSKLHITDLYCIPRNMRLNITDYILKYNPYIRKLNLVDNKYVSDQGIKYLTKLEALILMDNQNITGDGLINCKNLLILSFDRLSTINTKTTIPINIKNTLRELYIIGDMNISPNELYGMNKLEILYLSGDCSITFLPYEIKKKLKIFKFSKYFISSELVGFESLEDLYISNNKSFIIFPDEIKKTLKRLYIYSNNMNLTNQHLIDMNKLEYIEICGRTGINDNLQLPKLQKINII